MKLLLIVTALLAMAVFGMGHITGQAINSWWIDSNVKVISTDGVCLYVVKWGYGAGIAAVPKSHLPPGVGCQ